MSRLTSVVGAAVVLAACSSSSGPGTPEPYQPSMTSVISANSDGGGGTVDGGTVDGGTVDGGTVDGGTCSLADAGAPTLIYETPCYPSSFLPTGSCDQASSVSCSFCAGIQCPGTMNTPGPRTDYSCVCQSGMWNCTIAWQDEGVCAIAVDGG